MHAIIRLTLTLLCLATIAATASAGGAIIRMSDKQSISFPRMITDMAGSDVVFVADTHDDKKCHELQLEIIRSLQAQKKPLAIGLEMFQSDYQKQLDDWVDGKIPEQLFKETYAANWSYDWSLYRDIFIYARDNHIPLVGVNVPKKIVIKVARQGFASLSPLERNDLPSDITCDINQPQTEFLKRTFQEVFKHEANGKIFANFCEAQGLRNSGMAKNIATDQKKHPGRKLVVLSGTWHAVKHGIPERLENAGNIRYSVILPEIPELGAANVSAAITDYLIEHQ